VDDISSDMIDTSIPNDMIDTGIPKVAGSIPAVAKQTFQLARCGCTFSVTSQSSYSPEYITPTHANM
jgi:hypothetical protein